MRPHFAFALLTLLAVTACGTNPDTTPGTTAPAGPFDESGVRAVLAMQERAWDAGDIPAFMEGYADTACFVTINARTCGRAAVTAKYQKAYPTKADMGDLSFIVHEVLPIGPANAWCTGQWTIHEATDTLTGGFSLLWAKSADGWKIVRDHTY